MSTKPDGTSEKKTQTTKASVYKTKSTKPAERDAKRKESDAWRVRHMKVPRGTERARRRVGLHQGWRNEQGKGVVRMQPPKGYVQVEASTHNFTSVAELEEALGATLGNPPKTRATPEEVLKKNQAGVEKVTKTVTRTRKPKAPKEVGL